MSQVSPPFSLIYLYTCPRFSNHSPIYLSAISPVSHSVIFCILYILVTYPWSSACLSVMHSSHSVPAIPVSTCCGCLACFGFWALPLDPLPWTLPSSVELPVPCPAPYFSCLVLFALTLSKNFTHFIINVLFSFFFWWPVCLCLQLSSACLMFFCKKHDSTL